MSRISRYQDSINKFFKNKSCSLFSENNKNIVENMYPEINHIISILLLTTLNSQCRKGNIKFHGYYIATGIDILWMIVKINDSKKYYDNIYGDIQIYNFCLESTILIYNCLSQNINSFQDINNNKIIKIYQNCINYLNKNINKCISYNKIKNGNINVNPLIYKFTKSNTNDEYLKLKSINETDIDKYICEKYGTLCSIALTLGWLMGNGDDKMIPIIEKIGINFGYIIKIANDFKNIERDINNSDNNISTNIVINIGIIKSYIKFIENKTSFIENSLFLGIYNITIKEIMDIIEKEIDIYLNYATIFI